jgi:transposase InsO family protein
VAWPVQALCDLREYGERCGENRVYRLMHMAGLRAQVGYRRPRHRSRAPHVLVPNRLQRQFSTATPNEAWVTDITYIRTHECWIYLAVMLDLFSRRVIGWWLQSRIKKELALDGFDKLTSGDQRNQVSGLWYQATALLHSVYALVLSSR